MSRVLSRDLAVLAAILAFCVTASIGDVILEMTTPTPTEKCGFIDYEDTGSYRTVTGHYTRSDGPMSLQLCKQKCLQEENCKAVSFDAYMLPHPCAWHNTVPEDKISDQGTLDSTLSIKDCTSTSSSNTPDPFMNTASPNIEDATTARPVIEGTTTSSPVIEGTTTASLVIEGTTTSSPVIEGTTASRPVIEGTTTSRPVIEGTTTPSPVFEGTTTSSPVIEGTTTSSPVIDGTTTDRPVIEETTTAKPVIEDTTTDFPFIEDTTTARPVIEDTTTERPVIEDTTTDRPIIEDITTSMPIIEETTTAGSIQVDGSWSPWEAWSTCDRICINGRRWRGRNRKCDNPAPAHGGQNCAGHKKASGYCPSENCPVDGGWSQWGGWHACSKTCGGGWHLRYRKCISPAPAHGGRNCNGLHYDYWKQQCNTQQCSVNAAWGAWGRWSTCNRSCGGGRMTRYRTCYGPAAANGGPNCVGTSYEKYTCNNNRCPAYKYPNGWGGYYDDWQQPQGSWSASGGDSR